MSRETRRHPLHFLFTSFSVSKKAFIPKNEKRKNICVNSPVMGKNIKKAQRHI